eukprot:jgi/Bigna1/91335/estExt_fgenesh1_pg.C_970008
MSCETLPDEPLSLTHVGANESTVETTDKDIHTEDYGLDKKHVQQDASYIQQIDQNCSHCNEITPSPPEVRVLSTDEQLVSDKEKVFTITIAVRDDDEDDDYEQDDDEDDDCVDSQLSSPDCSSSISRRKRRGDEMVECVVPSASEQPIYIQLDANTLREALRGPKAIEYGSLADSPHSTLSTLISAEAAPQQDNGVQPLQDSFRAAVSPPLSSWESFPAKYCCCRASARISKMKMGLIITSAFVSILLVLLVASARVVYITELKDVAEVPGDSHFYHRHLPLPGDPRRNQNSPGYKSSSDSHQHRNQDQDHNPANLPLDPLQNTDNKTPSVENPPPPSVAAAAPPPEPLDDPGEAAARAAEQNLRNQQRIAEIARETAEKAAEENLKAQKRMAARNAAASARHQGRSQHVGKA